MSKVLFTSIVADMRGKLNGHVYAKNKGGNYVRTKTTPTNPQTASQSTARNNLGFSSQAWAGLTQAQRDSWNSAAPLSPYTDIFGTTRYLSGFGLFVKKFLNNRTAGGTGLTGYIAPGAIPSVATANLTATRTGTQLTTLDVETIALGDETGSVLIVEATAPIKGSVSNVNNEFRLLTVYSPWDGETVSILGDYVAMFGNSVQAGQRLTVRLSVVELASGTRTFGQKFETILA